MAKIDLIEIKNLQSGLIMESAVSETRVPLDAVTESINWQFDRIGCATSRKGLTALGDSGVLSGSALGLYEFRDSGAGTNNRIIVVSGTTVYYLSGTTWTSKRTSLTAGSKARFSTFLDFVFMVNGTEATAIWDGAAGNSFVTTGNAASAPTGKYIENFKSRMWIAGNTTYPDRLYFSSIPSAVATPVITWDTDVATGQWIDISPSDGENITALRRDRSSLLVFKNNHIYRVFSSEETEPDPKINVGTYSNESVVTTKVGIFFHHPSGFYKYADGEVQEISRPIQDIVDNILASNYDDICGWEDGDHVYWSVGNVTIDGTTHSNVTVRYTISSQVWTMYTYPTQFLFPSNYNDGTNLFRLVADNSGNVLKVNVGNTDNGSPINLSLVHRWMTMDGLFSTEKTMSDIMFLHNNGAGLKVSYQTQDNTTSEWKDLGTMGNRDSILKESVKGRKIRFKISGVSKGEPITYIGFENLDADSMPVSVNKNG